MLRNVSYNNKKIQEEIWKAVGGQFSLWDRIKMRGIGSPKMTVTTCSPDIAVELNKDNYANKAYIELRPKGVCIYFRSLLETFSLTIPYYRMTIYNNSGLIKIYGESSWVEFAYSEKARVFFDKVMQQRVEYLERYSNAPI
jgi:hypothetical protein